MRSSPAPSRPTAHPRSRGEHIRCRADGVCARGSSPLARGTPQFRCPQEPLVRLIPARAGNTSGALRFRRAAPAHPRSRGEHGTPSSGSLSVSGSSPLARGTHVSKAVPPKTVRLIPARAGNTQPVASSTLCLTAHPRSRGEHEPTPLRALETCGSSPLARGTPEVLRSIRSKARLIPARAGNTLMQALRLSVPSAHPRSRGEH